MGAFSADGQQRSYITVCQVSEEKMRMLMDCVYGSVIGVIMSHLMESTTILKEDYICGR